MVNQQLVSSTQLAVQEIDEVFLDNQLLNLREHAYYMLYKPTGYLSTEAEANHPSALSLILDDTPKLHAAGRLDVDTTGLLLLTSDGKWSHRVSSPKANKFKQYRVELTNAIDDKHIASLREGILLRGEDKPTKPALVKRLTKTTICIEISEGRYHQVKRMLAAVGNRVLCLHRQRIGEITLDESLKPGEYRQLSAQEISYF